jgi:hypothetical protein
MTQELQVLASHLKRIEAGCAKELVSRIKALRDEVFEISKHKVKPSSTEETVDLMVAQIRKRVRQLSN